MDRTGIKHDALTLGTSDQYHQIHQIPIVGLVWRRSFEASYNYIQERTEKIMLKIKAIRATLGKSVTAKLKNTKDDQERIIEFSLSQLSLTHQQLTELVACNEHERKFAAVAFVLNDAISELRHFKKMELMTEVQDAIVILDRIGTSGNKLKLVGCTLKSIYVSFTAAEKCMISCKVWASLEEHALYTIGAWGSQDVFVAIESKKHGDEDEGPNTILNFHDRKPVDKTLN